MRNEPLNLCPLSIVHRPSSVSQENPLPKQTWLTRTMDKIQYWIAIYVVNKRTSAMHVSSYRRSGGSSGGRVLNLPVLLLTATGRKSGQPRTVPLVYITDGPNYVVTASNSGREKPPLWYLNLKANPHATIEIGHEKKEVTAEIAGPDDKRRLWPILVRKAHVFAMYQKRTSREIDMVILHPD
jgi:deazaflavin-dependent oxidoreductase (nitroreductase family)